MCSMGPLRPERASHWPGFTEASGRTSDLVSFPCLDAILRSTVRPEAGLLGSRLWAPKEGGTRMKLEA